MVYKLKNEHITIQVNSLGSELISVIDNQGREYIYQPSERWIGQAKNLFPNVGVVKDDYIMVNGKRYPLMQHGFAKDMEFEEHEVSDTTIALILKSSQQTKRHLPYSFNLIIRFSLSGRAIRQTYEVRNLNYEDIYFAVGSHTGFNTAQGSYIDFGENEDVKEIERIGNTFLTGKTLPFALENANLILGERIFDEGFILDGFVKKALTLHSPAIHQEVTVMFEEFRYVTIWSKGSAQEFICIEPWCGLPDHKDSNHRFEEKKGNVKLKGGGVFNVTQMFIFE